MDIEQKIKTKLLSKGFSKDTLLNNRSLIGATIDETILEIVKKIGTVSNQKELLLAFGNKLTLAVNGEKYKGMPEYVDGFIKSNL